MAERMNALGDLLDFPTTTDASPASLDSVPLPSAEEPTRALPTGTVTFLLTDIEGSTRSWEAHGERMGEAVARHYAILDAAVTGHRGVRPIEQGEGDSMVAAFARASDAAGAALEAQRALAGEKWPEGTEITARMALHTAEADLRDECFYIGPSLARCARLRALAHGGQVLISNTTADLLVDGLPDGAALLPLGVHRLRDLRQPERIFQLVHRALRTNFPPLRSLDVLPNNLPAQLTSFIGRDAEIVELGALLTQHRLVTLVGAGGCGKTRLAAQLAADVADRHPGGVWWVELALLSDPDQVPQTVMTALGLADARGLDALERITRYVADQRVLLVLDNCEHVLGAVARLVDGILRTCPSVVALATSREPVGTPGEVAWRVPPLSVPPDGEPQSPEATLASEAGRLFLDRAVDARPTFRMDTDNAPMVAAICARVDGLPLAIELAAARVRSLSPERILDGLAHRFRLLTGGARTAVARQQTLQASVEWSHDLLSDAEKILLRRLAAFTGGFSLEAAEAVTAGAPLERWEILTLLSDLVDRSLVNFDGHRYRLLQTIQDFAAGQLLGVGEADTLRDCHAAHYLAVAEAAAADLAQDPGAATLASLEADHDNLLGALQWVLARGDCHSGLRLVGALAIFWKIRGHYFEALGWFRRVLASAPPEPSVLRARALWGLGHISKWSMDAPGGYGVAETQEAMAMARQLGDPALLARSLVDQAVFEIFLAPDAALTTLEKAVEAARQAGEGWALGSALSLLAFSWIFNRDRYDRASPILDELAGLSSSPYWQTWHRMCAGFAAWRQGRLVVRGIDP